MKDTYHRKELHIFRVNLVSFAKRVYLLCLTVLPFKLRLRIEYIRNMHRLPHVKDAERFSEKLLARSLWDQSSILRAISGKVEMKRMVAEQTNGEDLMIAQTVWQGDEQEFYQRPPLIPADTDWVLKPNNLGGGLVHFGSGAASADANVASFFSRAYALRRNYLRNAAIGWRDSECGYLIEQRIGRDEIVRDYKVHVFGGHAKVFSVYEDRFGGISAVHYGIPFEPLFTTGAGSFKDASSYPFLQRMLDLAENLTFGLSYLRVDFYFSNGRVWFGELTPFPGFEGLRKHPHLDRQWGELWPQWHSSLD